jgi:hypothetical protein
VFIFKTSPSFSPAVGRFASRNQGIGQTLFFIYAARALFSFRDEKEDTISGFCVDEGLVLAI